MEVAADKLVDKGSQVALSISTDKWWEINQLNGHKLDGQRRFRKQ